MKCAYHARNARFQIAHLRWERKGGIIVVCCLSQRSAFAAEKKNCSNFEGNGGKWENDEQEKTENNRSRADVTTALFSIGISCMTT